MNKPLFSAKLEQDFIQEAIRVNRPLMTVLAILAMIVECLHLAEILMFSETGLQDENNRIYFGFYLLLFLMACLYLAADRRKNMEPAIRYRLTLAAGSVFLLWQTLFSIYDVGKALSPWVIMTGAALVAFAALVVMKPLYAAVNLGLNFALLILWIPVNAGYTPEVLFRYTLTAAVCFVIYFIRFRSIRIQLLQRKEIVDISRQLEESRKQFRLSSRQYELILQKSHFISFEWNIVEGEVRFSQEWENVFGRKCVIRDAERFIREIHSLKQQTKTEILLCMENLRNGMPYQKQDLLLPVADGSERWFEIHLAMQAGQTEVPEVGIGLLVDIMDQKQRIIELEKELQRDNFTRLLNKTAMESYGARKLGELQNGERLYMLILDIDDFKSVNDSHGHLCGDYVLAKVAEMMRDLAPEGARVGRLGGDEFGAIFATERKGEVFFQYARRLVEGIRQIRWEGTDVGAGGSVGIAVSRSGDSWTKLYGEADRALYMAKRFGKSRIYIKMGKQDEQIRNL